MNRTGRRLQVLTVIGTRPEAIKLAPVVLELHERHGEIESRVCLTSQHAQLAANTMAEFDITVDHDLAVMTFDQTPTEVMARILAGLEHLLEVERPDRMLVQGDTTTVVAASLAAFYAGIPVGHVEAGLRSHDLEHPFPEEAHRRIATIVADLHFAPTESASSNLIADGVSVDRILVTGNPGIDALRLALEKGEGANDPVMDIPHGHRLVLVTAHRRESIGEGVRSICAAIRNVAAAHRSTVQIAFLLHPNPRVNGPVRAELDSVPNITLLEPLSYVQTVGLLSRASLVLTDSGGLQEEAATLGIPALVMRERTERPDGVDAGSAFVVGRDSDAIVRRAEVLLDDADEYSRSAVPRRVYGDGHAAPRIVDAILEAGRV